MSDDIVTRLRQCWCHEGFKMNNRVDPKCDHDGVRAEAANALLAHDAEIERLRRAIETFINVYSNSYTTLEIERLAIEELKEAVRGE